MGAYAELATALAQILNTIYAPEGLTAVHDDLHPSLGSAETVVGIAPERWQANPQNRTEKWTFVTVKFFHKWDKQINPSQTVDPAIIAEFAERFEQGIVTYRATNLGSGDVWYFDVDQIEFPEDPTGNKTRFHATVRARGNNTVVTA